MCSGKCVWMEGEGGEKLCCVKSQELAESLQPTINQRGEKEGDVDPDPIVSMTL